MDITELMETVTANFNRTENPPPEPVPMPPKRIVTAKFETSIPMKKLPDLSQAVYHCKLGCYYAVATAFYDTYELHRNAFALDSKKSLVTEVADYYTESIYRYFFRLSALINEYCRLIGNMDSCKLIARFVLEAREYLLQEYQREILEHPNLYALPPLSRYVKKSVLYKKPANVRPARTPLSLLIAEPRYRILSVTPAINALRTDTETLYRHFIDQAHKTYMIYLHGIFTAVNSVGIPVTTNRYGDELNDCVSQLSKTEKDLSESKKEPIDKEVSQ